MGQRLKTFLMPIWRLLSLCFTLISQLGSTMSLGCKERHQLIYRREKEKENHEHNGLADAKDAVKVQLTRETASSVQSERRRR